MKNNFLTLAFLIFFSICNPFSLGNEPTLDEIVNAVEYMENYITDVNTEYIWQIVPPYTSKETEVDPDVFGPIIRVKDGISKHKLTASTFQITRSNRTPLEGPKQWMFEESAEMLFEGKSWNNLSIRAFDGNEYKKLDIGSEGKDYKNSYVNSAAEEPPPFILTPLGFSVFRTGFSPVFANMPLSAFLQEANIVIFNSEVQKVNDFNTVNVDLLQEQTKNVVAKIYFSVDHGYTPVRFEYWEGGKPETNFVKTTIDIESLEKVGDNLWFPSAGVIRGSDSEQIDMFYTTKPIKINEGLTKEDFNIKFPKGTKVYNNRNNKQYIVE